MGEDVEAARRGENSARGGHEAKRSLEEICRQPVAVVALPRGYFQRRLCGGVGEEFGVLLSNDKGGFTREVWAVPLPQFFRAAPGLVLPVTRKFSWGDPANCKIAMTKV